MTKWVKKYTSLMAPNVEGEMDKMYLINPDPMSDPQKEESRIMVFGSNLSDKVVAALNKENVDING